MTLTIARLDLRLPAGFETRADGIVAALGGALAALEMSTPCERAVLRVPPLRFDATASDADIGGAIARAIGRGLKDGAR